jgi:UDP-N-acetylglucosamine--N-acetylmuramyl-(pentapeptide) pyrophosphoryl-undecaprenol N-acetylglucosamine transferase
MRPTKRIFVTGGGTGGHLYPGLAIARALVRLDPSVAPFFIGARRGIEREVLPKTEFPHELLDLHPLYRQRPWRNWQTLMGGVGAWRELGALVRRERPLAIVGTGGYAAGAALAYGVINRVPIMLQEADSHPGKTTRFFSRWASEVFLGFPEGKGMLRPGPHTRINVFGNPIEPPPVPSPDRVAARARWGIDGDRRVLLVFGGSQGAQAINAAVAGWIARGLPENLSIIWGTGRANFEEYAALESPSVKVRAYLSPITDAYAASDLALTRAGAMTIAELCAWGLPTVLVPLPTAAADHQTANARALESAGAAIHLPQRELSAEHLDALMRSLVTDPARLAQFATAAAERGRPNAAEQIARRILESV